MVNLSADGRRWTAVGSGHGPDAAEAGAAAARAALSGRDDAVLMVVFASDALDADVLLKGIRSESAGIPLIGCTTAGEIRTDGAGDDSVVITAFGGPGFSATTGVARDVSSDLHGAGGTAASIVDMDNEGLTRVLILLSDGLAGNQQEIVRGAYATLGATTPIVGGCAGDGMRMKATTQLLDDEVLTDSIVSAALYSDAPIGIGVQHGWEPVGERMLVTASGQNAIARIDDKPALDVYLDRLDAPDEVRNDPDAFTQFSILHPLGMERRSGYEVRAVRGADFETRSLLCIAEVPQGELVYVLEGDDQTVLAATDAACEDAAAALGDAPPLGLLAFDCVARRGVMGDPGIGQEIARITERFPQTPVAGFYTYGEFARIHGARGFHNQTIVVLAVS